ncbi:MAG: secreted protein [Acidimicrobiaceae bacterium]|nr:secreted protein [Acidimicrobiaceae bacterium]
MRRHPLALVLGPLAGSGALFGAVVAVLARRAVAVRDRPRYRRRLLAVGEDEVVLARDLETERPGTYGLAWPGGHGVVGPPVHLDDGTVVRPLVELHWGTPLPGRAAMDHVHVGDPRSSFGLDFEDIALPGPVGDLPAWVVPGSRSDVWVLLAHGYGGSRSSALSFLPIIHELGCTALVVSYRNDPGAPASSDRRYHLGASEWEDLDAAMAYALAAGARRLALFGWSMGGAIALQALARSERRDFVSAVVLDSPVLDWRPVLTHVARSNHVPRPLAAAALRLIERQVGIAFDDFDWLARAAELKTPVLCFHGEGDATVPVAESLELARLRPDLVELVVQPAAGHVGSWNVDPVAYGTRLKRFLARELLGEND